MEAVSSFFEKDHREIDEILAGVPFDASAGALTAFERFHERLERHIRWEEEILFPAVSGKAPMLEMGPVRVMRMEHEEIRREMAAALEALRDGDGRAARAHAEAMAGVLEGHNLKEERVLYPACDELLSPDEVREILGRVRGLPHRG